MLTGCVTMALAELSKAKGTILHAETLGFETLAENLYKKRRSATPKQLREDIPSLSLYLLPLVVGFNGGI
jgi:hypothetical protein